MSTLDDDPIEAAQVHVVALAALASLLADDRVARPEDSVRVDRERAAAVALLPGDTAAISAAIDAAWDHRDGAANAIRSRLGQMAKLAAGETEWDAQPEAVLLAQGRASANLARVFEKIVNADPDLAARLDYGGAILDVGTGVGALARALAQGFPRASVVGIDRSAVPLRLAERELAADPDVAGRVTFERGDIVTFDRPAAFDLVWLPTPFIAEAELEGAYRACRSALRDGGRLVIGLDGDPGHDEQAIARRWVAAQTGRSSESVAEAERRLTDLGFTDLETYPTVPGGPTLCSARAADAGGAD